MLDNPRLLAIASILTGLSACGDNSRADATTLGGTTTGVTTAAPSDDEGVDDVGDSTSGGGGDEDTAGPSTDETTGGGGPSCETIQCGDACCEAGQECVLDQCLSVCETGVRCGDDLATCCAEGDVCLAPNCVTPGVECTDSFDCDVNEFCEPTLMRCLPQQEDVTCEVEPEFEEIEVEVEWAFTTEQIVGLPLVADIDPDPDPEVIISTWFHDDDGDGDEDEAHLAGIIVVLDGVTGQEQFRIINDPGNGQFGSYGRSSPGVADVNGNGLPDIIYAGRPVGGANVNESLVHAVDGLGNHLWSSRSPGINPEPYHIYIRNGAPTFGNFDDDPESEIVFGATLIDNDGTVVWDAGGDGSGGRFGSNSGYAGGIAAIADIVGPGGVGPLDGYPEIISGRHAWSVSWASTNPPSVTVTELWDAGENEEGWDFEPDPDNPDDPVNPYPRVDGYPAVADLDLDGDPEVVLVADGTVRILEADTGELWCGRDPTGVACAGNPELRTAPIGLDVLPPDFGIPSRYRGGPPTIADFDGDGRPEIGVAGQVSYVVIDLNREGEEIVQPNGAPAPGVGDLYVRWQAATRDWSSAATGSSVFDFQGDGTAEVLYNDECFFRVYNGSTGDVILEEPSTSRTVHEYPVIADVDADGNTEILVVSGERGNADPCVEGQLDVVRRGLYVYGDPNDRWVRTRRVWNQHAYHVTNSDSTGLTPAAELNNWEQPGLNNYRQNVQGEGVFNAPDLSVDLAVSLSDCLEDEFELLATVRNVGALGVDAGITVSLYQGVDATGEIVGTQPTPEALLPGASTTVTWRVPAPQNDSLQFFVTIDEPEGAEGTVIECVEDNNDSATETVSCGVAG